MVKVYSIIAELIRNTHQTSLHVVSSNDDRTWKTKDATCIHVLAMDGKRQVIMVVSITGNNKSLLLQVLTARITVRSLPPTSVGRENCI